MFKTIKNDDVLIGTIKTILSTVLIYTVVIFLWWLGSGIYNYFRCEAQTIDIGFNHRYSIVGGCQIEVENNKWIPLSSYYFKQE